jgi:flagellar motor switch protein FliG
MKTASEDMKEHQFKGMSKRAGDRIRDDLALLGAVKLSDVEAAQQEIVEAALALDAEGVISLDGQAGTVE